jgi:hypothetical protein
VGLFKKGRPTYAQAWESEFGKQLARATWTDVDVGAKASMLLTFYKLATEATDEGVRERKVIACSQRDREVVDGVFGTHAQEQGVTAQDLERDLSDDKLLRMNREMIVRDPVAAQVAQETVKDWIERLPEFAQHCGESDHGATGVERMLVEAYAAASAARQAVAAGETSGEAILNEQYAIAQQQAASGVTKEWVVGFAQLRCIAIAYMLGTVGPTEVAEDFGSHFWSSEFGKEVAQLWHGE